MKKLLFAALLFPASVAVAQKGLEKMIAAERAFAAYAVAHNFRDAFLKFMDTAAVMFEKGEPVKSYPRWQQREVRPGVLNWWPAYAEVAASGDFGYTCGPWTFQPKTLADSVVATGYFFTVWQKNTAGEWKFILDVGTDAGPINRDTAVGRFTEPKTKASPESLLNTERDFIAKYKEDAKEAWRLYGSRTGVEVNENERISGLSGATALSTTNSVAAKSRHTFQILGSGIAPSGDLGYVYGRVENGDKKETYVRLWRHEPSGWKIAVRFMRL